MLKQPSPLVLTALLLPTLISGCLGSSDSSNSFSGARTNPSQVVDGLNVTATPQGRCGPGSRPETGMQGRVSQADHDAGLAAAGFACNTQMVGLQAGEAAPTKDFVSVA